MRNETTVRQWVENFNNGMYNGTTFDDSCKAGWYDWFCSISSLPKKTQRLGKIVVRLSKSPKIDIDNTYVWFKNNCPMYGNLYDDIRISDIVSGTNIWVITPSCGHKNPRDYKKAQVCGESTGYDIVVSGNMKDVYKFFEV